MSAVVITQRRGRERPGKAGAARRPGGQATRARSTPVMLPCRIRLQDGRVFSGELPAVRHRALQIGMLHAETDGLVEVAVGFRRNGTLVIPRLKYSQFLPGGKTGNASWLDDMLAAAEQQSRRRGGDVFVAPPARALAQGGKEAVSHTQVLWVDTDKPGQLHRLWALLAERPCHLLVESGGSGGAHAYWLLEQPLPATCVVEKTGEVLEPIERAHLRLIHHLGVDTDGKSVGDRQCKNRSRLMRLAGTMNTKTGRHARIVQADFELPRYPIEQLVGDLPDPPGPRVRRAAGKHREANDPDDDIYKRIAPPEYFEQLAGITVPRSGLVHCPNPAHPDRNPSCSVGEDASRGWHCFGCGVGGAIYDLASLLLGGPTGQTLRGEAFTRAREYVVDAIGELR